MEKVARSLANGPPANVPELWAVTVGVLENLAREIHDGRDSHWHHIRMWTRIAGPTDPGPKTLVGMRYCSP